MPHCPLDIRKILPSYLLKYLISEINTGGHKIFNKQRKSLGNFARLSYGLRDLGFKPRQKTGNFPFSETSRPVMFNAYRCPFPGVKWPEREVDHSTPFSTMIKNEQRHTCISTPHILHHGVESHSFVLVIAYRIIILLKLILVLLVQTYYTYYRTWRFATIFTENIAPILNRKKPVHILTPYIGKMGFHIILGMVSGPFSSVFPSHLNPEFSYEYSE